MATEKRNSAWKYLEETAPDMAQELRQLEAKINFQELPSEIKIALGLELVMEPPLQEHREVIYIIFNHYREHDSEINWFTRAFDLGRGYERALNSKPRSKGER